MPEMSGSVRALYKRKQTDQRRTSPFINMSMSLVDRTRRYSPEFGSRVRSARLGTEDTGSMYVRTWRRRFHRSRDGR